MEHISRFLPSLPRFHGDKPTTESDSEQQPVKEIDEDKPEISDTESTKKVEKTNSPDKKTKDTDGIDNMAFTKTKGDDEEEKAMNSIFQSFNNFTSKFKFTSDKIENVEADEKAGDSADGAAEKAPKDEPNNEDAEKDSNLAVTEKKSNQEKEEEKEKSVDSPNDNNSNVINEENESSTNIPERTVSVPEVTTIVTAPEPSEAENKADEKRKQADKSFHSDNMLFFEGAKLSSPDLDLKRRHSTDVVSVPRPLNEELIQQDMEKKGIPFKRQSTKKHIPQGTREQMRRESYSPRVERKSRSLQTSSPIEVRRKTLAELAVESGYKGPKPPPDCVDAGTATTLKPEVSRDKVISASPKSPKSPKSEKGSSELHITGELYLTLEYCQENRVFTVHIHTANNLAVADNKRKTSDPYVKTYLLPDKRSKKKTRTVRDNLNPEFDEIIKYHIGYDELLTRTLLLTVWNDDLFSRDDFLGEVVVPLGHFLEKGNSLINSTAKWHKLGEKTDYEDQLTTPELIVALKYVTGDKVKKKGKKGQPIKGELLLQVLEAKNLPGKDADGMSDPFCKISLLPDKKGKTRHKTPIIKRSLNPSWNYKMNYEDLSIDDLHERVLEITVWDHDIASRDEFLGGVRLGSGGSGSEWDDSTEDEAQIWQTMLNRSNVWIQVVIPLRPTMDSRKNM